MKNRVIIVILTLLGLSFLFLSVILNFEMINIRLTELGSYIYLINKNESKKDHLNLVATYNLHKRLYDNKISEKSFTIEELKTSLILNEKEKDFKKHFTLKESLALSIINSLRYLIGKNSIKNITTNNSNKELDMGYFYERQKQYNKSLIIYDEILKKREGDKNQKSIINLHEGYCYSIIGEHEKAKDKFNTVISENKNTTLAITAMILLEYIEDFNKEILFIKKSDKTELEKGERLFKLIAFKEAETILENLAKDKESRDRDKILFYLARSKEESGKTNEAVKLFQKIIDSNPNSEYAKFSNRRMFLISNNIQDDSLESLVNKNSILTNDREFIEFSTLKENFKPNQKLLKEISSSKDKTKLQEDSELRDFITDSLKVVSDRLEKQKDKKNDFDKKIVNSKKFKNEFVYFYNKQGKKIKEVYYNNIGVLEYYEIYEYDKRGTIKKILHFDSKDQLIYYHSYTYNQKGEKETINTYGPDGKILEYY